MIVMVLGFSKSGTTLVAKTLHEAGIDMAPEAEGDYPGCPYEDTIGCKIIMDMISTPEKKSLYIPKLILENKRAIIRYINKRSEVSKDWGFKFPYLTFVYGIWKKYLPEHIAIGCKRTVAGVISHYEKHGKCSSKMTMKIEDTRAYYNNLIDYYGIPIIWFEDFIMHGPSVLEPLIGRKLPDVRKV